MFLGLTVLDYVLILLFASYAVTGYRQGLVVSVLSLAGFLAGGALAMWLLPLAVNQWAALDASPLLRSVVLIAGVFILASVGQVHWIWVLAGLGLASMDWIGGGLRLWVVTRQVHPEPPLGGMILAGGMSAWAAYLTPVQSGAGPMMIYTMKRSGVPVPVAMTSTLMTFVATVAFFAIAGPLAILLGAGKALGQRGDVLGLSLYDLFLGSLGIFAGLGLLMVAVMVFPGFARDVIHRLTRWAGRRHQKVADRLERLRAGIDQAHGSLLKFNTPRGWLSLERMGEPSIEPGRHVRRNLARNRQR